MTHPLTQYRQDHGLSIEDMAKLVGTTRQSIHRIETGGQTPSFDMAEKIIAATNNALSVDDLMPRLAAFRNTHSIGAAE